MDALVTVANVLNSAGCFVKDGLWLRLLSSSAVGCGVEAKRFADAVEKAWDEAEAWPRAEIEFRIQAVRKAQKEADARLEIARNAREDAERKTQEMIDLAHRVHGAAINQALSEMMARVRAEQQTATEERVRAAAERVEDSLSGLTGQSRIAAYIAFFVPPVRSPH